MKFNWDFDELLWRIWSLTKAPHVKFYVVGCDRFLHINIKILSFCERITRTMYDRKIAIKGGIKLKMRIYRRVSVMRPTRPAPAPPPPAQVCSIFEKCRCSWRHTTLRATRFDHPTPNLFWSKAYFSFYRTRKVGSGRNSVFCLTWQNLC